MAADYSLRRSDRMPLGSFAQMQTAIRDVFPATQFAWRKSGNEQVRDLQSRGLPIPEAMERTLKSVPSILEGDVVFADCQLKFQLGPAEPVSMIIMQISGDDSNLEKPLTALELALGASFKAGALDTWSTGVY